MKTIKHLLQWGCLFLFLLIPMNDYNFSPELMRQAILQQQQEQQSETPSTLQPIKPPLHEDSKKQQILRAAIMALGVGMDIDSTNKAMHTPGMEEQNSWLYGKHPSLGRLIGTKLAYNLPLLWSAHKVAQEKGPIDGLMPVIFPSLVQGLAGGMNYALINKQKKLNANGGGEE